MRIAILTVDEPLYLPDFFNRFLAKRGRDVAGIFICEPVYKNQTKSTMLIRYIKTFGIWNAAYLTWRVVAAKIRDALQIGFKKQRFNSITSVGRFHNTDVCFSEDVNASQFIKQLKSLNVDLILSVSCPQLFKEDLISLPAKGCLNLHGADLPKYRGIMPSFWMLANGEQQAGATIFFINAGIDTGDVAGKHLFPIFPEDTLDSFIIRSKREACDLALETLDKIEGGTISRTPLQGEGSYFGWPTREAYLRFRKQGRKLR